MNGDKTLQNYFDSIRSLEFNARDWQVELISNEGQLIIFSTIFCNLETLHEGQFLELFDTSSVSFDVNHTVENQTGTIE